MKPVAVLLVLVLFLSFAACSKPPELAGGPTVIISYADSELELTSTLLVNRNKAQSLLDAPDIPEMYMRHWDSFSIDVSGAEAIKVSDYDESFAPSKPLLLLETDLARESDGKFHYTTKHSSELFNYPAGWSEVETRYYLITFKVDGQKYGCCFSIYHDGSHL
jgi:hypothetical protein